MQCLENMSYKIVTNKEAVEIELAAMSRVKTVKLLSGAWDEPYALACVVFDNVMADAELHERAADIWFVRKGSAKFILGGELKNPISLRKGEKTAASIAGGKEQEVAEGDVIDIPPGVPHQIDARGGRIELLIVKVNRL